LQTTIGLSARGSSTGPAGPCQPRIPRPLGGGWGRRLRLWLVSAVLPFLGGLSFHLASAFIAPGVVGGFRGMSAGRRCKSRELSERRFVRTGRSRLVVIHAQLPENGLAAFRDASRHGEGGGSPGAFAESIIGASVVEPGPGRAAGGYFRGGQGFGQVGGRHDDSSALGYPGTATDNDRQVHTRAVWILWVVATNQAGR
jgi:hypothetical protein